MRGKSDPIAPCAAATAVLSGRATGTPKSRDGVVETVWVLRTARRHQALDAQISPLVKQAAPTLLELYGVGPETAGQRLASAGDNPEHMGSEGVFTHLAGVAPIPASSGRTHRHRPNRDGDRAANNALHTIVLVRMRFDERTRAYVERRTKEGLSKKDMSAASNDSLPVRSTAP
ncbi:IS110 family transposase [Streptomyces mirabilis]|uniref:IS110 family transposase n=1 Tax=Streptomyces mirabilis TaxID=68239 RepID=UPI0021C0B202|nr:IS110 family transposase [Streptomyces mirabilis]MCT9105380.1 IS110 family transposase [Streptomyces mirabilis]